MTGAHHSAWAALSEERHYIIEDHRTRLRPKECRCFRLPTQPHSRCCTFWVLFRQSYQYWVYILAEHAEIRGGFSVLLSTDQVQLRNVHSAFERVPLHILLIILSSSTHALESLIHSCYALCHWKARRCASVCLKQVQTSRNYLVSFYTHSQGSTTWQYYCVPSQNHSL